MLDQIVSRETSQNEDRRIYGVVIAEVINNLDATNNARVQLRLPWLPGYEPWARLAVLSGGKERGTYFVPQVGDEVLVAFNHGDIREPFVIGSLWNQMDPPPATLQTDPVSKRIIRTPLGHVVEFDDLTQSITITTTTQQKIVMAPEKIALETTSGTAKVTLDTAGSITIQAATGIELKASSIKLDASANLELKGGSSVALKGGASATIEGAIVKIN